jgi:hypothetical protein
MANRRSPTPTTLQEALVAIRRVERWRSALRPGTRAHAVAVAEERWLAGQIWKMADQQDPGPGSDP